MKMAKVELYDELNKLVHELVWHDIPLDLNELTSEVFIDGNYSPGRYVCLWLFIIQLSEYRPAVLEEARTLFKNHPARREFEFEYRKRKFKRQFLNFISTIATTVKNL